MNREMAATFGHAPEDPEMVKEASYRDAFTKLAAEEGIDLSSLPDIDVANEYSAFRNQLKLAEIQQAKFAEFERVGRHLAHAAIYKFAVDEMSKLGASPWFSQIDPLLQSAQPEHLRAIAGQLDPQLEALVNAGHITPDEASTLAGRLGMDPAIVSGRKGAWHKGWGQGGALAAPTARQSFETVAKGRTGPMSIEELIAHVSAPKAGGGLLAEYSPRGLGTALSKGNWGTALKKIAPIGAAVMGGKWLLDRRRERELAGQQASMGASPAVSMAGV